MIPYGRQSIDEYDIGAVVAALKGEFLTTGPLVELFEQKLEEVVGAPCVVVSSGTAALHCAYAAINLQPGDEVITPPITFIATQATAAMFGAKIVFADIQLDTGNIDPEVVEALITSRTKAIVAVDYAGHPADLDELRKIADKFGVYLIEDAAHSIGSSYKDRPVGSIADLTTFSFFPTKNITSGEGGAISSPNPELLLKARRFSRQGLIRSPEEFIIRNEGPWHQEVHEFGLNYRLPDVLCALGLSQLSRISNFKKKREEIYTRYQMNFDGVKNLTVPITKNYVDPMWHLYHVHLDPQIRAFVFSQMWASGIRTQVNYLPAYRHPIFLKQGFEIGDYPNSDFFYESEISLPMHVNLSIEQIDNISNILKGFIT